MPVVRFDTSSTFGTAQRYARCLDPTAHLITLKSAELWGSEWKGTSLHIPNRGIFVWCDTRPHPTTVAANGKRTLYLLRGRIGWSVKHLVEKTRFCAEACFEWREDAFWVREDAVGEWITAAVEG